MKYAINRYINEKSDSLFAIYKVSTYNRMYDYGNYDLEVLGQQSLIERNGDMLDKDALYIELSKSYIGSLP